MKITTQLLGQLATVLMFVIAGIGSASAQSNVGRAIVEKLAVKVSVVEKACAGDIRKYCRTVTPGEGRMIYCMQAHEDKISPKCAYELGQTAASVQATADLLKDGVLACKVEIASVCGKTLPGQGRIAGCLIENKSTASKGCADAIQRLEAMAAQ